MKIAYFAVGSLHNRGWSVDGGKFIRIPFIEELIYRNNQVVWLGIDREINIINPYTKLFGFDKNNYIYSLEDNVERGGNFDNCDCCFIELRPFFSKDGYSFEEEANKQKYLIDYFYSKGKPVFIHDQDGWYESIPDEYAKKIHLLCAYENQIKDNRFLSKHKFIWAWSRCLPESMIVEKFDNRIFDFMYCGNVYGRRDEFKKYLTKIHDANLLVGITGNWLRKKYDDRDFSLDTFPKFIFIGQTEHWSTIPFNRMANCVFHISNPEQQKLGIICIRVFEALMSGCLLFANKNIYGIEKYVSEFQLFDNDEELLDKYIYLKKNNYFLKQYLIFKEKMEQYNIQNHVDNFLNIFEEIK